LSNNGNSQMLHNLNPTDEYEPLEVRRQRYVAGLLIRAITCALFIGVFGVMAVLMQPEARIHFVYASAVLVGLIVLNYPLWLVGKAFSFPLEHFYAHWIVDLFLITLLVHTLGGIELPCGFGAYLIMIVTSAVFLSERAAMIIATESILFYDGLVILDHIGVLQPVNLWDHHFSLAVKIITVLVANVFFYFFAVLVGSLSRQLKAVNVELRTARDALEKYSQGLEDNVRARTLALEQKNREIEEFVHIVTHDLRNTSVGVAELARRLVDMDRTKLSEKGLRYASSLRDDTRSLNQMLNHLLALFRVDHSVSQVGSVDVNKIVESIVKTNERKIKEKGIKVTIGRMPLIAADSVQLSHVIANLFDNAVKYTGDKVDPAISIESTEENDVYRITIRDNGIGVPEVQKVRIFQLYQRGTVQRVGGRVQDGAGIGLAIAKRIVERWGGSIRLESELGTGSAFSFTISKRPQAPSDEADLVASEEAKEGRSL
jgi:signal transduction histidine kinase